MLNGFLRFVGNMRLRLRLLLKSWCSPTMAPELSDLIGIINKQREQLTVFEIRHGSDQNTINTYRDENRRLRLANETFPSHEPPKAHGPALVWLSGGRHWHEANWTATGWRVLIGRTTQPVIRWRRMPVGPVDRGLPYQARNGVAS